MKGCRPLIVIFIAFLFSSCAYNGRFHYPIKINHRVDELSVFSYGRDTLNFRFNKGTKSIDIRDRKGVSKHPNFKIETFNFQSGSGNTLHGWLLIPKNTEPIATILHFHGSANDILTQYQAISPLTEYGFQIITFDYSGYGFSEGKVTRNNSLKDAYSFLEVAKNHEKVQNTKVVLYGQSYGGYLATVVGANRQNDIDGVVIEGAFTSHKDEAKYEVPFWGNLVRNEKHADKEIKKNRKPLLIIHSTEDKKVPIIFGKKIYQNANQPKAFYKIDKPHILGLQYYAEEIAEKIDSLILK